MIKSRHDTAFFQRSYSSGSSHGMATLQINLRLSILHLQATQNEPSRF
ncbi:MULTISPECIES: hypothetical protein [unclassified Rickettsia]